MGFWNNLKNKFKGKPRQYQVGGDNVRQVQTGGDYIVPLAVLMDAQNNTQSDVDNAERHQSQDNSDSPSGGGTQEDYKDYGTTEYYDSGSTVDKTSYDGYGAPISDSGSSYSSSSDSSSSYDSGSSSYDSGGGSYDGGSY